MVGFYKEHQRFTQWWLWGLIFLSIAPMAYAFGKGMYQQFILGEPWGDQPMSDTGLVLTIVGTSLIMGGVIWLLFTAELTIEVHDRTIYYRFTPFIAQNRRIGMEEIASWKVEKYNPFTDVGGYGWRKGFGRKPAYNVKGRIGLHLELKNGKKLLLGTQKANELKAAVQYEIDKMSNPDYL